MSECFPFFVVVGSLSVELSIIGSLAAAPIVYDHSKMKL
jgi:hypothetical protein